VMMLSEVAQVTISERYPQRWIWLMIGNVMGYDICYDMGNEQESWTGVLCHIFR